MHPGHPVAQDHRPLIGNADFMSSAESPREPRSDHTSAQVSGRDGDETRLLPRPAPRSTTWLPTARLPPPVSPAVAESPNFDVDGMVMHFDDDEDRHRHASETAGLGPGEGLDELSAMSPSAASPAAAAAGQGARRRPPRRLQHRSRLAALAKLTARDGVHFTVLTQEGAMAPVFRDFATANALLAFLKMQEGRFSALTYHESDDEPNPHSLERSLSRHIQQRSFSDDESADEKHRKHSTHGDATAIVHEAQSSRSSSASTMSGLLPDRTMWIDVQCEDHETIEEILSIFPRLDRDTIEDLLQHDAVDTAHWFHTSRYLFSNIQCAVALSNNQSFAAPRGALEPAAHGMVDPMQNGSTVVSVVAFSDVCVTVHGKPFLGHRSLLQNLHGLTSRGEKEVPVGRAAAAPADGTHRHSKRQRLTIGVIVATLVESVVFALLPDPTACLAEVDRIDEMVLLVRKDSRDLLRRIARVRRILSTYRSMLFRKERFLQQFTSPAFRATFISGFTAEQYRHTLGEVYHVAERLEAARDVLTQANSNFVSHVSLQTSVISNNMNKKMKALSQVATVCLPLNIITGLFGMNVTVPYQTSETNHSLAAFFTIIGVMVAFLLIGVPFMWYSMHAAQDDEDITGVNLHDD